ncbi:hypothetical protein SLS57_009987 [Botryosphaeria dothidea]
MRPQRSTNFVPARTNWVFQTKRDCISLARELWPTALNVHVKHHARAGQRWCTLYVEYAPRGMNNAATRRYEQRRGNVALVGPSVDAGRANALGAVEGVWYGVMKAKVAVERGVAESVEKGLDVAWEEMEGTWPHMSTTVDIDVHTANFGTGPHTALLLDRRSTTTAVYGQLRQGRTATITRPDPDASPVVWYRSAGHAARADALREIRGYVQRMLEVRRWADEVRARTGTQADGVGIGSEEAAVEAERSGEEGEEEEAGDGEGEGGV